MGRGALIAIEGCDRTGKSLLAEVLRDKIDANSVRYTAFIIRNPNKYSNTGKILRDYLNQDLELTDVVAHHLFSANIWESASDFKDSIRYSTLICDRYIASTSAYTAAKGNLSLDWCEQFKAGLPKPDLVIYLECDIDTLASREHFGADRFETKNFQQSVKKQFENLREEAGDWLTVDVNTLSLTETCEKIFPTVKDLVFRLQRETHPLKYFE